MNDDHKDEAAQEITEDQLSNVKGGTKDTLSSDMDRKLDDGSIDLTNTDGFNIGMPGKKVTRYVK